MSTLLPSIYRDCRLLLVHTEDLVRYSSRHHEYTVGTCLLQTGTCTPSKAAC